MVTSMEDFRNTCRLCFLRGQQLEDSFAVEQLTSKIEHCLGITISPVDFPATLVCSRCITLLNHFHHFKQLCLGYEQTFREIVRKHREVIPSYPPMVVIKPEPPEHPPYQPIELEPLDVKPEPVSEGYDEAIPSTSGYVPPSASNVTPPLITPIKIEDLQGNTLQRQPAKRSRNLNDATASDIPSEPLRMVYDGHRYTLVEFFPDGTSLWRCWGYTCKKLLHISPEGLIHTRKDSVEHSHPPGITSVNEVTVEGRHELYAVFDDVHSCTMMVFRNALWGVTPGAGCFIATCREIVASERRTCGAKVRIQVGYASFEMLTPKCSGHGTALQYLIRRTAEPLEGDAIVWDEYRRMYPFYLSDGSVLEGSRYYHMYIGGFRYTNQSLLWTGGSLLRCAQQKCPAKGRLMTSGLFVAPTHPHEVAEHLQGMIWSVQRQQQERFLVHITHKKTMATLHYNTYSYALRDERRNVWCCYPDSCNASLRIEGDFERVVDVIEHTHDGTLTVIRDDETPESELVLVPAKGNRKRPRDASASTVEEVRAPCEIDASTVSPKLAALCQLLVKKTAKQLEYTVPRTIPLLHHFNFHTYSKRTVQPDGKIKLECYKFRCPGRTVLNATDQSILSSTEHSHPKTFTNYGTIQDVATGTPHLYIFINGTQKKNVTYFVCNGFRYNCMAKGSVREANSEWICAKCSVRIMLSDGFSTIEQSSTHDHDPTDMIIPFAENPSQTPEAATSTDSQPSSWDEVIWGDHRYTSAIHMRRLNRIKWQCCQRKDCRGAVFQCTDGSFEVVTPHDHEGPVQWLGEARFDRELKMMDRYAILKAGERPKCRTLIFQNQKYYEGNVNEWVCVRKLCSGKLLASQDYGELQLIEGHCHQPMKTAIRFHHES
uniref:ZAD domain-containing protein n=1 Tax=Culex tarsalis TaxID=7177 RepID=A0A1Q3F1C9_CULTA